MAHTNPIQVAETVGAVGPIELNGVIYSPMTTIDARRAQRSRVSKYNDEDLRMLREFKYRPLKSMKRTMRLLRLKAGGQKNPEISCELFVVQFDGENLVREVERSGGRGVAQPGPAQSDPDARTANAVDYEALSWCWGTASKDCGIRVTVGASSHRRLAISRELILALKYLRRPNEDRVLWIDALCIDQANHEERNHQVQMMSRIYSCAKQVCVWLGEDNNDSAIAIKFIREIMQLENFDAISEEKENTHKWQSLLLLMQRPWFSRRWVVQEIALARAATIHCGNDQIPWEQFAVAVELFVEVETATHRLSEVMRKDEAFNHVPQWFEHVSQLGASVLVQATGRVFRQDGSQTARALQNTPRTVNRDRSKAFRSPSKTPDSTSRKEIAPWNPRPLLSLEYLVSSLSVFQASQPRDVVYSLLTISRDTSPFAELRSTTHEGSEEATIMSTISSFLERKPFKVDYSRPLTDVCKDFISFCIQGAKESDPTRALDILCRPWAPEVSNIGSAVVHKKPVPYKFDKSREKLYMGARKPLLRKADTTENGTTENGTIGNGTIENGTTENDTTKVENENRTMVHDNRTPGQYMRDTRKKDTLDRNSESVEFERLATRFLPKPNVERPVPRNAGDQNDDSEESESENQVEEPEEEDIDLPSWVSPVSGAPFALYYHPGMHSMQRMGRSNADPLVGMPQEGHRNYNAAQDKKVDRVTFRKRPVLNHYSMYTKGFILEEVTEVAEPARLGAIPETWAELAGWKGAVDGDTEPPTDFWRTLVADRGKENRNPPYYYATACKESVKKGGLRGGSVDTASLINSEMNSIVAEFCRRVQAVIWNRRLIKTEGGTLGLAGPRVKPGDLVCILFGCTVPVILRRGDPKTENQIKDEIMQDRFESLKAVIADCEDACFRKLRYRKKLEELGRRSQVDRENWEEEIGEEKIAVNEQIADWKKRENADKEQREKDEHIKNKRKEAGAVRRDRRKRLRVNTFHRAPSIGTVDGNEQDDGEDVADFEKRMKEKKDKAEKEDPTFYYTLIGEAYIHGFMDGEAVRKQFLEGIPDRKFEIR